MHLKHLERLENMGAGVIVRQMLEERALAESRGLYWAVVGINELLGRWLHAAGGLAGEW